MKKLVSFLSILVIGTMLLTACGGAAAPTVEKAAAPAAAQVEKAKEISIGMLTAQSSFDPATAIDGAAAVANTQIYDTLVDSKNGVSADIKPKLAKSWTVSDDGLTITFKLRDDVYFHNGEKFKAADVKYTFERAMVEEVTAPDVEVIKSVEVVDDYTVTFNLKSRSADFFLTMGNNGESIVNEKAIKAAGDRFKYEPVGTGPYMVDPNNKPSPGQPFSLVANEKYWGGSPQIKKINFKIMLDLSTAVIALQKGEIDFLPDLPASAVKTVKADPKLQVIEAPSFWFLHLTFNKTKPPFSIQAVREAIGMAIKKQDLIDASFDGSGTPANSPLNSLMIGYTDKLPFENYDVAAAKKKLADAGYPNGFSTTCLIRMDKPWFIKIGQVLQAQLHEIGVEMTLKQLERPAWNTEMANRNFEMTIGGLNWPQTSYMLSFLYKSDGPHNYDKTFNNPQVDALLVSAQEETDYTKRAALYTQILNITAPFSLHIPLFFPSQIMGANAKLSGIKVYDNAYFPVFEWKLAD